MEPFEKSAEMPTQVRFPRITLAAEGIQLCRPDANKMGLNTKTITEAHTSNVRLTRLARGR